MKKTAQGKKVCAEFCDKFAPHRKDIKASDRVRFMLQHPEIRAKLDEWISLDSEAATAASQCHKDPNNTQNKGIGPNSPKRKTDYGKSATLSEQQRQLGNSLFVKRKLYESLDAYNQAIRYAPHASLIEECGAINQVGQKETLAQELLPLSLANRSAVYFELGEQFYNKSLADAALALKCGYPDRLKCKLLLRKANIYAKKKKWCRAQAGIDEVQNSLNDPSCQHSRDLIAKTDELKQHIKTAAKEDCRDCCKVDTSNTTAIEFEENPSFASALNHVELKYSEQSTRFVTAKKDLSKRSVVFKERPFASVLLPQFYKSHCHECHKLLEQNYFIPCQKCTQVKFCTQECATNAWNVYHQYECSSLDLLHSIGIAHLAIRCVFCVGLTAILATLGKDDLLRDPRNTEIFAKGRPEYDRVYSLLDHVEDMSSEDMFQYTLTAALLTNWLTKSTSFFSKSGTNPETQIKVGGCILRHICQLICNAHAITDILSDVNVDKITLSTADESQRRIATAIFPAASMMNHSCDPNISFVFKDGKTLFVKLTKDLAQGEEILNCYGPYWRRMGFNERREMLKDQYFFTCQCIPCIKESSTNTSFVDRFASFKCEKCEGPVPCTQAPPDDEEDCVGTCQLCGHSMSIRDHIFACLYTDRLLEDGEVLLNRGKCSDALEIFHTCKLQYGEFLYKHHSKVGRLCDMIGRCYSVLGDFPKAAEFVKQSLSYVEEQFGLESIEYGRELKKYIDLIVQGEGVRDKEEMDRLTNRYQAILSVFS